MAKKGTNAPAVTGTEGKPAKLRDIPPRLPPLTKHIHGLPPPIKVKVRDSMGMPTPSPTQPTGGTRKRQRTR
jgi:hypothetical protein